MPKHRTPDPVPPEPEEQVERLTLDVELQRLIDSGRQAFASELAFQKARVALAGKLAGRIAGLGALALALLFFVLMALVVGALIALGPVLGAWGALGVVLVVLLLATTACGLAIRAGVRTLKRVFKDGPDA